MKERVNYSKAPITEAVIDLRVTQAKDVSVNQLAEIRNIIGDLYPYHEEIYSFTGQIGFQIGDPTETKAGAAHKHIGFRLINQNKQQIFQARLDGFAFSTLAPYDRWESFRDEALRLWNMYRSATKVENITRAAVRYINRIDFPSKGIEKIELKDYLRTFPEVSPDWLNQIINGFFMQLQMWQNDLDSMLILNEATTEPPNPETISVLLDIDLFRERAEQPWTANDDAAVWEFLEQLHERKNHIFEGSITEKMRELIR